MRKCVEIGIEKKRKFTLRMEEIDARRAAPYHHKVSDSRQMVEGAIDKHGDKIAVACSFGKDSTVILHLAREVDPDVLVVFNNTLIEFRETYALRDRLKDEWNLNLIETRPKKGFWQCVDEYGYPKIRFKKKEPACCDYLKLNPMVEVVKENGLQAIMTGLNADESYQRKWVFAWYGDFYEMEKRMPWPVWKYHPIAFWSEEEVWRYIRENEIPENEAYKKHKIARVGCRFCTAHIGWEKQMARTDPAVYRKIAKVHSLEDFAAKSSIREGEKGDIGDRVEATLG
jgi:phosphoadenosine phosphosulfate reductase